MNSIPRHFHFIFGLREQTEPFHIAWYLCLRSCCEVNPDHRVTLYYLNEPHGSWWERIKNDITLVQLADSDIETAADVANDQRYREHPEGRFIQKAGLHYAHLADYLRLKILGEYGGIYADIDSLFVRPYPQQLYQEPCVMGKENEDADLPTLCNALIMAAPGSRFVSSWLDRMAEVFDGSWNRHSCIEPARLSEELGEEILVVGSAPFFHFRYDRNGLTDLFGRVSEVPEELCSIHMWNHLWWETWRNDFITFNHSHLNEKFIRHTDTTYNLLARRFLD